MESSFYDTFLAPHLSTTEHLNALFRFCLTPSVLRRVRGFKMDILQLSKKRCDGRGGQSDNLATEQVRAGSLHSDVKNTWLS